MSYLYELMQGPVGKGPFDAQTSKKLRKSVGRCLKTKARRRDLIHRFLDLEQLVPGFHEVFQWEEIEMLLADAVEDTLPSDVAGEPSSENWKDDAAAFVRFVADCTEFRDKPVLDKAGKPVVLRRTTPIHRAAEALCGCGSSLIPVLFEIYNRFDANYVDEKSGLTHFHAACMAGCEDVVAKFLEHGQDPNLASKSETPLHMALARGHAKVAELLLRAGADPNQASPRGKSAPLHLLQTVDQLELFLNICDKLKMQVLIDAPNERGATPLHCALMMGGDEAATIMAEALLRRGADPNLCDVDGLTPLHYVATYSSGSGDSVAATFFGVCERMSRPVGIDARDKEGCTPLHLALHYGDAKLAEFLLTKGADPNLADEEGMTPLHVICSREDDDCKDNKLATMFLETCKKIERPVDVNARDALGRTPLEWAVVTLKPNTADALLDHGADLSKFVCPSQDGFPELFAEADSDHQPDRLGDALKIVERLRARGCKVHKPRAKSFPDGIVRKSRESADGVQSIAEYYRNSFRKELEEKQLKKKSSKIKPEKAVNLLTGIDEMTKKLKLG